MGLFLKWHPKLSERVPESINKARALVNPREDSKFFSLRQGTSEEEGALDILEDFNADESCYQSCPKTGLVLGPKGYRNFYEIKVGNEKESITVRCAFSANGLTIPPMIVYPLKCISKGIAMNLNPEWGIGYGGYY